MTKGIYVSVYQQEQAIPQDKNATVMLRGNGTTENEVVNGVVPSWYGTESYAEGKFGNAFNLTGSNCIKIPYSDAVTFGNSDFTVACWIRQTDHLSGTYPRVFSHQYRYSSSYTYYGLRIEINTKDEVTACFQEKYSAETIISPGYVLPLNTWVHIALVRNGNKITLYIDGVAKGSATVSGSLYQNANASFKIGAGTNESASNDNPASFFIGQIDDFIITKKAVWTENFTPPTEPYVVNKSIAEGNYARRVKKAYVGNGEIARRIKKGYVGVNGIAKLFFTGKLKLIYKGTAAALSEARGNLACLGVGHNAIIAGGELSSTASTNSVDIYNALLVKSTGTPLNTARRRISTAKIGNNAIFAGGNTEKNTGTAAVDIYDGSLTRTNGTSLSQARHKGAGVSMVNKAIFGGGQNETSLYTTVDVYDESLTRTNGTSFNTARIYYTSKYFADNAIFAGGFTDYDHRKDTTLVEIYNESLTKSTATSLSSPRGGLMSAKTENHLLIAGGTRGYQNGLNGLTVVEVYNKSMTKLSNLELNKSSVYGTAFELGGRAIFAGGSTNEKYSGVTNEVNIFDDTLTRTNDYKLNTARFIPASDSFGDYALVAGGNNVSDMEVAVVDVFAME